MSCVDGENDESAIQQAIEQSTMSSVVACLSGEATNSSKTIIADAPVDLGTVYNLSHLKTKQNNNN
jgi:hypothetical protein